MEGPSVNPSLSTRPGTGQWSFPQKLGSYSTSFFTNKKIEIQSYQEAHPNGQLEEGGATPTGVPRGKLTTRSPPDPVALRLSYCTVACNGVYSVLLDVISISHSNHRCVYY